MNAQADAKPRIPSPSLTGRAMLRRLRESIWSAAGLSVAIHLAAFAILMRIAWQDKPEPPRTIIAEAWLGASGGGGNDNRASQAPNPAPKNTAPPKPAADTGTIGAIVPAAADPDLGRIIETVAADMTDTIPLPAEKPPTTAGLSLGTEGGPAAAGTGAGPGGFGGVSAGGPDSGFFGQRGNAYKVVYVIDTSGSLGWIFEPVQKALIDSIDKLRPTQSFHVIFAGAKPVELPEKKLVPAIRHYMDPAKTFIRQLVPELKCDPVAAMQRAFAVQPELIYFLSDGDFGPTGAELLAKIRQWNADKRVHITTIGFGVKLKNSSVAGAPIGESILRQLAEENGGNFRWVSPDDEKGTP